jgi:hypothetical protein
VWTLFSGRSRCKSLSVAIHCRNCQMLRRLYECQGLNHGRNWTQSSQGERYEPKKTEENRGCDVTKGRTNGE